MNGKDQQPKSAILLIGVGNDYRGDDGVGLLIARGLKALRLPNVAVIEEADDVAMLMEAWANADMVMLFDAVRSGAEPGTIHRFDAHARPIPAKLFRYSTHAFSVAEAIELARALGRLPPHLVVYGVEGRAFEAGITLSVEAETAAHRVVEQVAREIQSA